MDMIAKKEKTHSKLTQRIIFVCILLAFLLLAPLTFAYAEPDIPEEIEIYIYQNGRLLENQTNIIESKTWHIVLEVPKYDSYGNPFEYVVVEKKVAGFASEVYTYGDLLMDDYFVFIVNTPEDVHEDDKGITSKTPPSSLIPAHEPDRSDGFSSPPGPIRPVELSPHPEPERLSEQLYPDEPELYDEIEFDGETEIHDDYAPLDEWKEVNEDEPMTIDASPPLRDLPNTGVGIEEAVLYLAGVIGMLLLAMGVSIRYKILGKHVKTDTS